MRLTPGNTVYHYVYVDRQNPRRLMSIREIHPVEDKSSGAHFSVVLRNIFDESDALEVIDDKFRSRLKHVNEMEALAEMARTVV